MLASYFQLFAEKLRLSRPWKYKVPLLISFPYFMVLQGNLAHDTFWKSILAAYVTIIGFAGLAYWSNDRSDQEVDRLAGKQNAFESLSKAQRIFLPLLFGGMTLLPWFYLPGDNYSLLLIALELILFWAYAFRPFRLKERGVWGLLADAAYAHALPAVLASWTFYLLVGQVYKGMGVYLLLLLAWQMVSGVRNILSHQLKDFEADRNSGVKTWITEHGREKANRLMKRILLPLEIGSFLLFLSYLQQDIIYLLLVFLIHIVLAAFHFRKRLADTTETPVKHFTNAFLDNFYIKVFPLVLLSAIIFIETEVRLVLLMHLLFFHLPSPLKLLKKIEKKTERILYSSYIQCLYAYEKYYKGLIIHLGLMLAYFALFAAIYFSLAYFIENTTYFFNAQLFVSRLLVALVFLHLFSLFVFRKEQSIEELKRFLLRKEAAYNLAVLRIFAFFFISISIRVDVMTSFSKWAYLDESQKVALPFIGWLIEILPVTPEIYSLMAKAGLVLAYLIMLGFQTRWTSKLYLPIALYLWGVPCFYGKLNHHHIMVWVPALLAFSRCGDVLSVDALIRWIRGRFKRPEPSLVYGLPLRAVWISLAIIYFASGVHKLWDNGLHWALSDNQVNQIQLEWVENYDQIKAFRIDQYPGLLKLAGLMVVFFEITYPIYLLRGATRFFNIAGAWGLHLSAGYFLNIDFANLRRVHLSLVNWSSIPRLFSKKKVNKQSMVGEWKSLKHYSISYAAGILITANLLMSLAGINSWPFSAYPAYSSIVADTVSIIEIKAYDAKGQSVEVKQIGMEAGFRWENIRSFETRIIARVEKGDTLGLQEDILNYWDLWRTKVPGLESVTRLELEIQTTPLAPERRSELLERYELGSFYPQKQPDHE
jgi:hypothetical protein